VASTGPQSCISVVGHPAVGYRPAIAQWWRIQRTTTAFRAAVNETRSTNAAGIPAALADSLACAESATLSMGVLAEFWLAQGSKQEPRIPR
jgi:hypothetical protein